MYSKQRQRMSWHINTLILSILLTNKHSLKGISYKELRIHVTWLFINKFCIFGELKTFKTTYKTV